ncbi:MAG: M67 family metallopeptidase [Deltaproteobacteria bacterium]|nr:M67 family metallopeptidase [Deltaproteobacteria bacterium]
MLIISKTDLGAVRDHGRRDYPRECCGLLLGRRSGDAFVVERVYPARNRSPVDVVDRYELDAGDRHYAEEAARALGLSVVGFYHSHPDHDVYFSETDLRNSEEYLLGEPWLPPAYAYLVVSVREGKPDGHGAFIVNEGRSAAIDVKVDDPSEGSSSGD